MPQSWTEIVMITYSQIGFHVNETPTSIDVWMFELELWEYFVSYIWCESLMGGLLQFFLLSEERGEETRVGGGGSEGGRREEETK